VLDADASEVDDSTVIAWLKAALRRIGFFLDDALPMPPEQRNELEWTTISGDEQSDQRKRRLKLHMLEKRGKGGYR
jgi:hypothetical protein